MFCVSCLLVLIGCGAPLLLLPKTKGKMSAVPVTLVGSSIVKHMVPVPGVKSLGYSGLTTERLLGYILCGRLDLHTPIVIIYLGGNDLDCRLRRSVEDVIRTLLDIHQEIYQRYPWVTAIYQSELAPREGIPWWEFNQQLHFRFPLVFRVAMYLCRSQHARHGVLRADGIHITAAGYRKIRIALFRFLGRIN